MKLIGSILISYCALVLTANNAVIPHQWCSGAFLRGAVLRCQQAYRATQADVDDYFFVRWAANENANCFRACIFNEFQAFNPDDTIRPNVPSISAFLVSRVDEWKYHIVENVATNCLYTIPTGRNRCDITEAYIRCIVDNTPARLDLTGAV